MHIALPEATPCLHAIAIAIHFPGKAFTTSTTSVPADQACSTIQASSGSSFNSNDCDMSIMWLAVSGSGKSLNRGHFSSTSSGLVEPSSYPSGAEEVTHSGFDSSLATAAVEFSGGNPPIEIQTDPGYCLSGGMARLVSFCLRSRCLLLQIDLTPHISSLVGMFSMIYFSLILGILADSKPSVFDLF
ncbi:unnamed protein product [Protopolystoma xenopodis]|uniref:Uncharacterized protein n=1 Tax=Protopolystoma xenopodis TaxID=117903 RepID=A0A3S5CNM4_9PLAT|nr:unnamed protein product [Protopolystoma xenopodis]